MPQRRLASMVIEAVDEFQHVIDLQKLIHIALEQLDNPEADVQDRIAMLLICYCHEVEDRLEQVQHVHEALLKRVRRKEVTKKLSLTLINSEKPEGDRPD